MKITSALCAFAVSMAGVVGAATNYVDCSLSDYSGHDGSSWEKAFETIQEAVDAAAANDTVLVAPGRYDKGAVLDNVSNGGNSNRVWISKALTLKSRDGAASTFIVGAPDPDTGDLGDKATRCVLVSASANVVVEGFTITGGYTKNGDNNCHSQGAGVRAARGSHFAVDCVFTGNKGTRGGGMYGGSAVRCLFHDNTATQLGSAMRNSNAYNTIFEREGLTTVRAVVTMSRVINCTFVNCGYALRSESNVSNDFCNCVFSCCGDIVQINGVKPSLRSSASEAAVKADYKSMSVDFDDNTGCLLFAPAVGDYRPLNNALAVANGNVEYLDYIPEKYRYTDFNGSVRTNEEGKVDRGAIQGAATAVGGVCYFGQNSSDGTVYVNGNALAQPAVYAHSETWPNQFEITAVAKDAENKPFWGFTDTRTSAYRHPYPYNGGSVFVTAPSSGAMTNKEYYATSKPIYVAEDGDDGYAGEDLGDKDHPYGTIQAAVNSLAANDNYRYFVYVGEGTYDKGGELFKEVTNRVYICDCKHVRIIATGERGKT